MLEIKDVNEFDLEGEFVILKDGVKEVYTKYSDIPDKFDNVISFEVKPLDWGDEVDQVKMNSVAHYKFLKLMEREKR